MSRQAFIITDLTYGDAGKGSLTDYLTRTRQAHTVIRHNGGAQAAHNVVTPDGRHHTFSQFGSGTFIPGTRTYLSRYMLLDPLAMLNENDYLQTIGVQDALARTLLDRRAPLITPYHQATNRLRELARGADRHGSCGMGIGETVQDYLAYGKRVPLAGDLADGMTLALKLRFIQELKRAAVQDLTLPDNEAAAEALAVFDDPELIPACMEVYGYLAGLLTLDDGTRLAALLREPGTVIFEGAQGVLLDEWYGFHPYTTWSTTTAANAHTLLSEHGYSGQITTAGVLRAYMTRHGAGPLVTEDAALSVALPDAHNVTTPWQQHFRVGHFDRVVLRYALAVNGDTDALVITCLDRLKEAAGWQWCAAYHSPAPPDKLARYFTHENSHIHAITPVPTPDLNHQSALTDHLAHCTPVYTLLEVTDTHALADRIADALGVPLWITSHGPAADDKIERRRMPS